MFNDRRRMERKPAKFLVRVKQGSLYLKGVATDYSVLGLRFEYQGDVLMTGVPVEVSVLDELLRTAIHFDGVVRWTNAGVCGIEDTVVSRMVDRNQMKRAA